MKCNWAGLTMKRAFGLDQTGLNWFGWDWIVSGTTLRAILHATSVTRRGYTIATFRATLHATFDQRLPSSHAMMFTSCNCTFVKPNINICTETKRPFAAFPRAAATPCRHASNIKADIRSEWKYPEQNVWIPNHR